MGLGSSLKKAVKKISKGLKKIAHLPLAISKKTWKEVKRAWNTKLGRILLIGAAIWVTGGLLAMKFGIASGTSAFSFGNVVAGYSQAGSVLAGKLGMEGLSAKLAVAPEGAAAITETAAGATMNVGGMTAAIPGTAAPAMTGAQVAATEAAAAAAGGGGAAAAGGGGFLDMSTGAGIATAGLLSAGGQALAAANEPTPGEILRDVQRANSLTSFKPPQFGPNVPTARFVTPGLQPRQPAPPTPGLLEPEPDGSMGYGG